MTHDSPSFTLEAQLEDAKARIAELEKRLMAQVDAGPLLHSGGGQPHALTFLGRKWVPLERTEAAEARAKGLEAAILRAIDGCFCDDADGNCGTLQPTCPRCVELTAALDGGAK